MRTFKNNERQKAPEPICSAATTGYLDCPWCGAQPYVFQGGMLWCSNDNCQSRKQTRMTCEDWNRRADEVEKEEGIMSLTAHAIAQLEGIITGIRLGNKIIEKEFSRIDRGTYSFHIVLDER